MDDRKVDIRKIRQEISKRGLRWRAGKTAFTDLPVKEMRRKLGWRLPDERSRRMYRQRIVRFKRTFVYPSAFDWREYQKADWTTPIRDQGSCGSCVAFGVAATMESQWNIQNNNSKIDKDLSEAHLFFCGGSCGCSFGWWVPPALTYAQDHGVSTETCFPYQDHDMPCKLCKNWEKESLRIVKWKEITGISERKQLLAKHGPLVGCMDVYEDFTTYTGGVYQYATGDKLGGHCISIVGYDDNQNCWICKNSWGTDWGESGGLSSEIGWFRIAYGQCGIDTDYPAYTITNLVEGGIKDGEDQGTTPCCLSAVVKDTPYEQDLDLVRNFRDTHLLESVTAQKYIDIYYRHSEAIVDVLRTDKRSRELAFSLIDTVFNAIKATATSQQFTINEEVIGQAQELVKRIIRYAPEDLRSELKMYGDELDELLSIGRGKKLVEFAKTVQKYSSKKRPR